MIKLSELIQAVNRRSYKLHFVAVGLIALSNSLHAYSHRPYGIGRDNCVLAETLHLRIASRLSPCSPSRDARVLLDTAERDLEQNVPASIRADAFRGRKADIFLGELPVSDGLFIADESHSPRIELRSSLLSSPDARTLLAHELFHWIQFVIHPNEESWIREGLAQIFSYLVTGITNGANIEAAFRKPETPLMSTFSPHSIDPAAYGHTFLYFYYLLRRCAPPTERTDFFWKIARPDTAARSTTGIDQALRNPRTNPSRGECRDFRSSALAFEVARAHNRVDYHHGSDATLLYPTTWKWRARTTAPTEREMQNLVPYSPILLQSGIALSQRNELPPSVIAIWLEQHYPFAVEFIRPSDPSRFRLLLIKTDL